MSHEKHSHHPVREHHHDIYPVNECDGSGHEHHHHSDGSCCCEHHAQEFHGIQKPMLVRLILAAILYLICAVFHLSETLAIVFLAASALLSGYDIIYEAGKRLFTRRFFDECFLMSFAAIAAFIIGECEEGAAVFLLYRIGDFCQSYAIRHSKKTISSLTGECTTDHEESVNSKFITKFARIYTPVILVLAVLIALLLPLITDTTLKSAVYRALTFLVVACPCAIVISVPLAYFAGIASASRRGIYFRDAAAIDAIAAQHPEQSSLKNVSIKYKTAFIYSRSGAADAHTSELVLTGDVELQTAVKIAKKAHRIARENVIFTIAVKVIVLLLGAMGISALWFAVFADSGVTIITVLNSLRSFRVKK